MTEVANLLGLPAYSETPDVPDYTINPLPNEQSLAVNGRVRRSSPDGGFTKQTKNGGVTLVLNTSEDEDSGLPVYGRNELIEGIVHIRDWENTALAQVKVEAKMRLEIYTSFSGPWEGGIDLTLMSHIIDLWSQDTINPAPPPTLRFSFRPPTMFEDAGTLANLPPSFFINFPGLLGLTASVTYSISVQLPHIKKKGLQPSSTTLSTNYQYYPRTRPQQPILRPPLTSFSNISALPDHWTHYDCSLVSRTRKTQPLKCNFILPALRTFALESTIPFHVQLVSSSAAASLFRTQEQIGSNGIRSLFRFNGSRSVQSNLPVSEPADDSTDKKGVDSGVKKTGPYKPIRVSLLRQVSVTVRGQTMTENRLYGIGKLKSVGDVGGSLTWEGEITPSKNLTVPAFKAPGLVIKDFIVLNVDAPNADLSPLQFAVPIRYATDLFEAGSAVETPSSD